MDKSEANARRRARYAALSPEQKAALNERQRVYSKGYYERNPEKFRRASTRWRHAHPERVKELRAAQNLRNHANGKPLEWHWRHKFGMTIEEGMALFDRQGGCCAICSTPLERPAYGSLKTHLDHDHTTSLVRGFLCIRCNQGLGRFLDDPTLLEIAIEYLRSA